MTQRQSNEAWLNEATGKIEPLLKLQNAAETKKSLAYNEALGSIQAFCASVFASPSDGNKLDILKKCIISDVRIVPLLLPKGIRPKALAYFNALDEYKAISARVTKAQKKVERLNAFNTNPILALSDNNYKLSTVMTSLSEPAQSKLIDIASTLAKKLHQDKINDTQYANILNGVKVISDIDLFDHIKSIESLERYREILFVSTPGEDILVIISSSVLLVGIVYFSLGLSYANHPEIKAGAICMAIGIVFLGVAICSVAQRYDIDLSLKLFGLSRAVNEHYSNARHDYDTQYAQSYDKFCKLSRSETPDSSGSVDETRAMSAGLIANILPKTAINLPAETKAKWSAMMVAICEIADATDESTVAQAAKKYKTNHASLGSDVYHFFSRSCSSPSPNRIVSEFAQAKLRDLGRCKVIMLAV